MSYTGLSKNRYLLHAQAPLGEAEVVFVPLPYEGSASYLKGVSEGPQAIIAASSAALSVRLSTVTPPSPQHGTHRGDQVAGQQTALPLVRGTVCRRPVQANPQSSGLQRRDMLSQQGANDAAENITHAATGHTGVTIIAQQKLLAISDQAAVALE